MAEEDDRGDGGSKQDGDDSTAAFLAMDSFYDKLKILDYDAEFCRKLGMKPIPRHYFAVTENANEQLFYFGSLMSWMLSVAGQRFPAPDQYDDPNQIATNIVIELRKQGLPAECSTTKLKQGSGEEVCQVLNNLANMALKARKFKFARPEHGNDDNIEETPHVEDVEVVADRVVEQDEVAEDLADDDDDAYVESTGPASSKADGAAASAAPVDSLSEAEVQAWLSEVERVAPQLKVHLRTDAKDWRGHVEEMKTNKENIGSSLTSTRGQLEKLSQEITKTMEKIASREKYVNTQLEGLLHEYRAQQDEHAAITQLWTQSSGGLSEKARELASITDELERVKAKLDEKGTSMTDASPLVKIKQALNKLKAEIVQMDMRMGVIEHILLSASLRDKAAMVHDMHAVPVLDAE